MKKARGVSPHLFDFFVLLSISIIPSSTGLLGHGFQLYFPRLFIDLRGISLKPGLDIKKEPEERTGAKPVPPLRLTHYSTTILVRERNIQTGRKLDVVPLNSRRTG